MKKTYTFTVSLALVSLLLASCNKKDNQFNRNVRNLPFGSTTNPENVLPNTAPSGQGAPGGDRTGTAGPCDANCQAIEKYKKEKAEELKKKLDEKMTREGLENIDKAYEKALESLEGITVLDGKDRATPQWKELCKKEEKLTGSDSDNDGIVDDCEDHLNELGYHAMNKNIYNGWVGRAVNLSHENIKAENESGFWKTLKQQFSDRTKYNKALAEKINELRSRDGTESDIGVISSIMNEGKDLFGITQQRAQSRLRNNPFNPNAFLLKGGYGNEALLYDTTKLSTTQFSIDDVNGIGKNIENLKEGDQFMVTFGAYVYMPEDSPKKMFLASQKGKNLDPEVADGFMVFQGNSLEITSIPNVLQTKAMRKTTRGQVIEPETELIQNGKCPTPVYVSMIVGEKAKRDWPNVNLFFQMEDKKVELAPQMISVISPPAGCEVDENFEKIFGAQAADGDKIDKTSGGNSSPQSQRFVDRLTQTNKDKFKVPQTIKELPKTDLSLGSRNVPSSTLGTLLGTKNKGLSLSSKPTRK